MNVGISGLGLMGGSLAKALARKAGYGNIVCVTRNKAALEAAIADGAIASGNADGDFSAFSNCDIVFLCVPVDKVAEQAAQIAPFLKSGCVLTDVGSVKGRVLEAVARVDLRGAVFVGGHPMAGSEKGGYENASETLYDGACYIITPTGDELAADRLAAVAKDAGALPVMMDAKEHDRVTASVSHGPHAVAAALVNAVRVMGDDSARMVAAGGFKDMTRISSSDPDIWRAISMENRAELLSFLAVVQSELAIFSQILRVGDDAGVRAFYAAAKQYRDGLGNGGGGV